MNISRLAIIGAGYEIRKGGGRTGSYRCMYTGHFRGRRVTEFCFDALGQCISEMETHYAARLSAVDMKVCPECNGSSAAIGLSDDCQVCRNTGVVNA